MKNKIIKLSLGFVLSAMLFSSCTKNFEELNTDETKLSTLDNASLDYVFSAAQYRGIFGPNQSVLRAGAFQVFENLYADLQAQYFATTALNFESDRNVMVGNWLTSSWSHFYGNAYPQLHVVLENTKPGGKFADPIKYAIANVWKVYIFMPVTDYWGAIPYSEAGNGKNEVLYDSQEDIYNDFLKILKESTTTLGAYSGTAKFFEKGDLIYGGDAKKWLKLCNTLRLRIALRISKVNPTLAKTEAEAAVLATGGLITANADNAWMKVSNNTPHPLGSNSDLNEFRMSAAMESVLKGYNDPRLQKFFNPVSGTTYKGIRNGLSRVQMGVTQNSTTANSNINTSFGAANKFTAPWPVYMASETHFLLAEGKLNGWTMNAGTAKTSYDAGIDASMAQWSVTDAVAITAYKNGITTPAALGDIYSTPALSNIPVAFGATEIVQREQVGTQKWLALFPYSPEAWSEFRRTGFPKLYPRLNSDNTDSPAGDAASVRRTIYPPIEITANPGGVASGISKLGSGGDKSSTKVWWNQ